MFLLLHKKTSATALLSIFFLNLARLSIFSHATVSLMLYRSPKNHVSLRPKVWHTKSKRSFPFHLTWKTKQQEISKTLFALFTILSVKFSGVQFFFQYECLGKFPYHFDIETFHHNFNVPVQSLYRSPHPAEACDRVRHTHKPISEPFHLKTSELAQGAIPGWSGKR